MTEIYLHFRCAHYGLYGRSDSFEEHEDEEEEESQEPEPTLAVIQRPGRGWSAEGTQRDCLLPPLPELQTHAGQ